MTISLTNAMVGTSCVFQTKIPTDGVTWEGEIEGLTGYTLAQMFNDIKSMNAAACQVDPTINSDYTQLLYFILKLQNPTTGQPQRYSFAQDWVVDASFKLINQQVAITLTVYDAPTNDHTQILVALNAAGYKAVITATTTVPGTAPLS